MRETSDEPVSTGTVSDVYERMFVAVVFAFMAIALYVYVWKFGRNVPFWDDWEFIPVLTGNAPFTLTWLWVPHNEHSIPIVRLVVYLVWKLTGDLRVVMWITSTVLCAGACALIAIARRLRGHTTFTDAVFPIALLTWGLFENHIFAIQFFFVMAAMLVVAIVLLGIGESTPSLGRIAGIVASIIGLPLFGSIGVALLPCLVACVAVTGYQMLRGTTSGSRRVGVVLIAACGVALAIAIASVLSLPEGAASSPRGPLIEVIRTGLEMLSTSTGQAGQRLWPYSAFGTFATVALAAWLAARSAWLQPEQRRAALFLLGGMGSLMSLVVAIGYGRAALNPGQGFSNRYALFSSTLLCLCYLSFSIYAKGGLGRFLRTGILLTLTAALVTNSWAGIVYGIDRADRADALVEAIDAGAPSDVLAARYAYRIYPMPELLAQRLEMLRVAKAGPFSRPEAFPTESPCRETALPLERFSVHEIYVDGTVFHGVGSDPFVIYTLPAQTYVCGMRITFTLTNPSLAAPAMQVFWANSPDTEIQEGRRDTSVTVDRTTAEQQQTVWIYSKIDRIRIDPDVQPCTFEIHDITFIIRDDAP